MPWACSYQDAAQAVGGRTTRVLVGFVVELAWVTSAIMSFSLAETALVDAIADTSWSITRMRVKLVLTACIWSVSQLQSLADASWISLGSSIGMLIAVGISVGSMVVSGQTSSPDEASSNLMPAATEDTNVACEDDGVKVQQVSSMCGDYGIEALLIFSSLTMVQDFVLDVMNGMKDSREFHKTNVTAYSMSCSIAIASGAACLALVGPLQQSYLIANVASAMIRAIGNALVAVKGILLYVLWNLLLISTWSCRLTAWLRGRRQMEQAAHHVTASGNSKPTLSKLPSITEHVLDSPNIRADSADDPQTNGDDHEAPTTMQPAKQDVSEPHPPATQSQHIDEDKEPGCFSGALVLPSWLIPRLRWFSLSTLLLAMSFIATELIPSLSSITGLSMALIAPPVMYGLPAWFFWKGSRMCEKPISIPDGVMIFLLLFVLTPGLAIAGTSCSVATLLAADGNVCPLQQ